MRAWDEHDALPVEQQTGCEMPGCQCNGRVEFMVRGSEDMTETDDSEWEDTTDRDNRSYVRSNNYNLSEGMAPRTYTPPLRRNRRRRYAIRKKYETDIEDYFSDTSDEGSRTGENPTSPEQPIQSIMIDDNVYTATLSDEKDTYSQSELTGLTECGVYSSTSELWGSVDRPVTKEDMARSGIRTDFPCREHSDMFDRPNTRSASAREGTDARFPRYEHSDKQSVLVDKPVTESLMSRSGSKTKLLSDELSEMVDRPVNKSVTAWNGHWLDYNPFYHGLLD